MPSSKIRVLVVDDSALVRDILSRGLSADPAIEVIGTARDPFEARDILVRQKPDVLTLDVEMPRMDGITFLKHYMHVLPTPTIMVSALTEAGARTTIRALEAGAIDFVTKPQLGIAGTLPELIGELTAKVKMAATVKLAHHRHDNARGAPPPPLPVVQRTLDASTDKVVAIGCSAGGTQALARILPQLPAAMPGIAIVQHMPPGFTASLAQRLDALCAIEVREASDGDRLRPGVALLAPGGDRQMSVARYGGQYLVRLASGPKVQSHCPSVDVLFRSIAANVGAHTVAVLLTGMGKDGAEGLKLIRASGGRTFVQDEATSVVWGMPGMAWQIGAAEAQLALDAVPRALVDAVTSIGDDRVRRNG